MESTSSLDRFAVNATTAIRESAGSFLSSAFTSRPFIRGIQKSSRITSGRLSGTCCRRYSNAAGPSDTESTRYPLSSRNSVTSSRSASSFSTTKTLHLAITHPRLALRQDRSAAPQSPSQNLSVLLASALVPQHVQRFRRFPCTVLNKILMASDCGASGDAASDFLQWFRSPKF